MDEYAPNKWKEEKKREGGRKGGVSQKYLESNKGTIMKMMKKKKKNRKNSKKRKRSRKD